MRQRLPWVLFALTCSITAAHVAVLVNGDRLMITRHAIAAGFPLVPLGAVIGAGVGALILSRYPRHRIGWLFLIGQLLTAFDVTAQAYGEAVLRGELGGAPGGSVAIWLSVIFGAIVTIAYLSILFLLAPNGQLLSPRWRWVVVVTIAGLAIHTAAVVSVPPHRFDASSNVDGEVGPAVELGALSGIVLVFLGLLAAAVSLVLRLRRSTGAARHQLWWMTAGAGLLAATLTISVPLTVFGAPAWTITLPVMIGYVCVPLFTGVAVLRHRLYDIDVFVNRAIALAVLSAIVTGGYVTLVVVIGRVVTPAEDAIWPSMLALALVALAVQPLRAGVARLAARIVYGKQSAPYEALADFSKGLQEAPTTLDFLPRVAETICQAVGAKRVTIWIDVPGTERAEVAWPDQVVTTPDLVVPLVSEKEELGGFTVSMPPARALRASEEQLLADFAVQLAQAFRIARLQAELSARVAEVDQKTVELTASSRRLTLAQAEERARFKAALRHAVLPHLEPLPAALHRLSDDVVNGRTEPDAVLDAMTQASIEALESLRTLTRGVFPAQLAHRGLASALSSHLADAGVSGILESDRSVSDHRFDPRVESATYFGAAEFLRELDEPDRVRLSVHGDHLALLVSGRAATDVGSSAHHLLDRAAALGGRAEITQTAGVAALRVDIPLAGPPGVPSAEDRVTV